MSINDECKGSIFLNVGNLPLVKIKSESSQTNYFRLAIKSHVILCGSLFDSFVFLFQH